MEQEILNYLIANKHQKNSITDIAKGMGRNRMSVAKYLCMLEIRKKVKCERIGMQKVWTAK